MDILVIVAVGALNIACFFIGSKLGQTVAKGKDIETPNINPMTAYKRHLEQKEVDREKNRLDIIMANIERYDGTGNGQEDVPSLDRG
jgi:hypothetical protein